MNKTQIQILKFVAENRPERTLGMVRRLKIGIKDLTLKNYLRTFIRNGWIEPPVYQITEKGREALVEALKAQALQEAQEALKEAGDEPV